MGLEGAPPALEGREDVVQKARDARCDLGDLGDLCGFGRGRRRHRADLGDDLVDDLGESAPGGLGLDGGGRLGGLGVHFSRGEAEDGANGTQAAAVEARVQEAGGLDGLLDVAGAEARFEELHEWHLAGEAVIRRGGEGGGGGLAKHNSQLFLGAKNRKIGKI